VPLADRGERARLAVVLVALGVLVPLGLDVRVDRARDGLVRPACLVLVDQRGTLAVVAHPCHEISQPRSAGRGEVVAGVPQIMEVQPLHTDGPHRVRPGRHPVEVAPPQRAAHRAGEDQCSGLVLDEDCQVLAQYRDDRLGNAHDATARPGLGWPMQNLPGGAFDKAARLRRTAGRRQRWPPPWEARPAHVGHSPDPRPGICKAQRIA
jgi:hypothetical protein